MNEPPSNNSSQEEATKLPSISESFERYDLTGDKVGKWTVSARQRLVDFIHRVIKFGRSAKDTKLPGTDESLGEKAANIPGKGVTFLEASIEKTSVDNQLKTSQTETEFFKQELIKEQIAKLKVERRGQQLANLEREIEIQERIKEITNGRTDVNITWDEDEPIVIVGNVEGLQPYQQKEPETIESLDISVRVLNLLNKIGIRYISDLQQCSADELLCQKGFGIATLNEVRDALSHADCKLRDD